MIVVDTNIIAYLYISGERSTQAEQLLSKSSVWAAPVLWRSELRNVLAGYLRRDFLQFDDVLRIMHEAEAVLGGNEFSVESRDIMRLVSDSNCSAYDCEFVALAQYLEVPLVTSDKQILLEFPDVAQSLESYVITESE